MHIVRMRAHSRSDIPKTMPLADQLDGQRHKKYRSWRRGIVVSGVHCMNEVNTRRALLLLG